MPEITKPAIGSTGWGQVLNNALDELEEAATSAQATADTSAGAAQTALDAANAAEADAQAASDLAATANAGLTSKVSASDLDSQTAALVVAATTTRTAIDARVALGGAVSSVQGYTGPVELTTDDVPDTSDNQYLSDTDASKLDSLRRTGWTTLTVDTVVDGGFTYDHYAVDATGGARAITLYQDVAGVTHYIQKVDASANAVTVTPSSIGGAGTINGGANVVLSKKDDWVEVQNTAVNTWRVLRSNLPIYGSLATAFSGKVDKTDQALTLEQFGARGDGTTDDTAALQAAIDSIAIDVGGNGVPALDILLRAGATYRITNTIDIIQRSVTIKGHGGQGNPSNVAARPGRGSTIRWDGAAGSPMLHLKDTFGCDFADFFLQGNITNRPSEGIYNEGYVSQEGNHGLKLDNVRFGSWGWTNPVTTTGTKSMDYGVRYGGSNANNDQFSFRDVIFNNCGVGLALPNSQSIWGETQNVLFEDCGVGLQSSARHHGFNLNFQGCGKDVELHSTAYLDVEGWHSENSGLIFDLLDESGLSVRGGQWTIMSTMSGNTYFAQAAALANNLSLDGIGVVYQITPIPLKVRGTYSPTPYTVRIKGCKGLDSLALLDIQGYGQSDVTFLDIDTQGIKYSQSISAVPLSAPTQTKTANYTLSTADRTVIGNGTSITIKLPDPTNCPTGTPYRIKNINSTDLTVASAGTSKTVDGSASRALPQWGTGTYVCDGTQWYSVSSGVATAGQPLSANLTTLAGLTPTTDNVVQSVSGSWASRTMAQLKATLALVKGDVGLSNVDNTADASKPVSTAQAAANAAVLAAAQPLDSDLTTIAGLTATTDNVIQSVAGAWASRTMAQLKTALTLVKGDVGLGNVDNTSDANKPVSTATGLALPGRNRVWVTGRYYGVEYPYTPGQAAFGDGFFAATPVWVHVSNTITSISAEVVIAAASSTIRMGIYGSNANDQPTGSPLLDAGTISSTTTGTKDIAVSLALTPGLYWFVVGAQGGAPTLRTIGNSYQPPVASGAPDSYGGGAAVNSYFMTGVSGALPTWSGAVENSAGYRVVVKAG